MLEFEGSKDSAVSNSQVSIALFGKEHSELPVINRSEALVYAKFLYALAKIKSGVKNDVTTSVRIDLPKGLSRAIIYFLNDRPSQTEIPTGHERPLVNADNLTGAIDKKKERVAGYITVHEKSPRTLSTGRKLVFAGGGNMNASRYVSVVGISAGNTDEPVAVVLHYRSTKDMLGGQVSVIGQSQFASLAVPIVER
jgi:hypothetical protein